MSTKEKIVVIVTGKGCIGKDDIRKIMEESYRVMNVSSMAPIIKIAHTGGCATRKGDKEQKLLAELRKIFIEYNDLPYVYTVNKYEAFLENSSQIMLVQIGEPEEISKFRKYVRAPVVVVGVPSERENELTASDYDYIYDGNKSYEETKADLKALLRRIMK